MKSMLLILVLAVYHVAFSQEKSYTIVFLNKKSDAGKIDPETQSTLMEGHMANIKRLAKEGKLLAAGPFEGGGGLFVFNTTSREKAEEWLNTDPAVRAKRWNVELLSYTPRIGSICPVSEPYEMVSYTLFRFDAVVEKFTTSTYPAIIRQHDEYLKQNIERAAIVTEAVFDSNEGGVLILKGDLPADIFAKDPGVQQGLLHVQRKKLFIARTSFCEE
jgi:uncharacterized protein YciI